MLLSCNCYQLFSIIPVNQQVTTGAINSATDKQLSVVYEDLKHPRRKLSIPINTNTFLYLWLYSIVAAVKQIKITSRQWCCVIVVHLNVTLEEYKVLIMADEAHHNRNFYHFLQVFSIHWHFGNASTKRYKKYIQKTYFNLLCLLNSVQYFKILKRYYELMGGR